MVKPGPPDKNQESELKHVAGEVFSSEKREDVWAIIIATAIFLVSVAFPDQTYHFFSKVLYLF